MDPVSGLSRHPIGKGAVGIDIGPQTLAYSAEGGADLVELADQVQCIEQEKSRLQRKMDRSRRASNPDNYVQDGTIKRGVKLTHNKSRRYCKLQKELAYPGEVAARFSGDVDTVEALFTSGIISMVADACRIISILAVIAVKNTGLALILIAVLPFFASLPVMCRRRPF